ncbi:restriction endonuclease subunit S [Caminicella sporogenes]|uniref:restriction endonuclease subunit S n=1 Tax=Caminicella sporogenes TaxID=166485 RepID=UPI00254226F3|nr:restriction endonuclease subunit S [Caminicella sporogenes]WIF94090.1 restriction endonuclease subunit S [Caminicella sporogenes]
MRDGKRVIGSEQLTMDNKNKYKKTELGKIPVDWEIKKLKQISNGNCEYGINAPAKEYEENSPRYLRITDIGNDYNLLDSDKKSVNADEEEIKRYFLKENDIVFARTGNTTGKSYLYNKKDGLLVFAGFLIKFSINNKIYEPKFLKYYVQTDYYWNWVKKMSLRSGQPGINSKEYSSLLVLVPPLKEQQKIAAILSTVDEYIEQTDALIEKIKELKKGLMQKLITKGIGHTEFKKTEIGEIPVDWEVKKLGDLGSTYNGLSGKNKDDFGRGKPFIPYKNIFDNSKIDINYLDHVVIKENENQNKVKYGDIFFTTSSETPEEVGMSSVILDEVDELYLNSFCFGFRLNDFNTLIPEFARYLFRGNEIRKKISRLAQGSTRFNLSKTQLLKIYIPIPPLKEQQKIASILSEVDNKIQQYELKKEKLQNLKKGLMQKLLTGKIRVKI